MEDECRNRKLSFDDTIQYSSILLEIAVIYFLLFLIPVLLYATRSTCICLQNIILVNIQQQVYSVRIITLTWLNVKSLDTRKL